MYGCALAHGLYVVYVTEVPYGVSVTHSLLREASYETVVGLACNVISATECACYSASVTNAL